MLKIAVPLSILVHFDGYGCRRCRYRKTFARQGSEKGIFPLKKLAFLDVFLQ